MAPKRCRGVLDLQVSSGVYVAVEGVTNTLLEKVEGKKEMANLVVLETSLNVGTPIGK
jgi:hypothetical protein